MMSEAHKKIIYGTRVAHVAFFIAEQPETAAFNVYSETKREGTCLIGETFDLDDAGHILNEAAEELEKKLEYLRKGPPTPRQLKFLFDQKIPIPLTLTWGEASDIIDERMKQIAIEKEERKQTREEVRRKKEIVRRNVFTPSYQPGEQVIHPSFGQGTVLHAGDTLANVQFHDEKKMVDVADLAPELAELPPF